MTTDRIPCGASVQVANRPPRLSLGVIVSVSRLHYGVRHGDGEVNHYIHDRVTELPPPDGKTS